jgi:hypothetical protein
MRGRLDFYRVALRGRPTYYLSLASLFASIALFVLSPYSFSLNWTAGAVLLLISSCLWAYDWARLKRAKIRVEKLESPWVRDVGIPGAEPVELHDGRGQSIVAVWPKVDEALPATTATVSRSRLPVKIPAAVQPYVIDILEAKTATRSVYNGKLIRQNTDLTAALLAEGGTVELGTTDYYTMLCTDYLADSRLMRQSSDGVVLHGPPLMTDRNLNLRPLSDQAMANVVGVSTLAFTADGVLALVLQAPTAQSSPGLWAPSGSGSMDPRDYRTLRESTELRAIVAAAMERELCEECNIRYDEIEWTRVLGFYRWLEKGGKPEYVGVTRLALGSDKLHGRPVRFVELPWVERSVCNIGVDLEALRDQPDSIPELHTVFDWERRPDVELQARISLPLFMCFRALGRALLREDSVGQDVRGIQPERFRAEESPA